MSYPPRLAVGLQSLAEQLEFVSQGHAGLFPRDTRRDVATDEGSEQGRPQLRHAGDAPAVGAEPGRRGPRPLRGSETARLDEVSAPTPDDHSYGPFGAQQRDRYIDRAIRDLL